MVNKINYDLKLLENKHKNKAAVILAHGPSLNSVLNSFELLNDKDTIIFGCNDWYNFYKNPPRYWVLANNLCSLITEKDFINKHKDALEVIYSDSADTTNRSWIENNIKAQVHGYDSRHFLSKKCSIRNVRHSIHNLNKALRGRENCCNHIIPNRYTLQEYLRIHSNSFLMYGPGATVALHQISLAVIMGCNPIYISGVDLDYRLGYANNADIKYKNYFDDSLVSILDDMKIINNSAKLLNINIFNLNQNSSFNIFPIFKRND
jgi:hypothetical protein